MSTITDAQVKQFHDQGYFVTDVVFTPEELSSMADEMDRVYQEKLAAAKTDAERDETRRARAFAPFHKMSPVAAEFVKKAVYVDAARRLVGHDVDLYYNQAATKPPERGRIFAWHQDSGYVETTPLPYITCWTAITDSNLANGCIWIIPGSHKWGLLPHVEEAETPEQYGGKTAQFDDESGAIPVEMKAGQVAIFSSLMLHRSGPNTSETLRRGFVPQYHVVAPIAQHTGGPWGDAFPILRDGKKVA